MESNASTHSPSLFSSTLRTTALILGASLGFVGVLCGAMVIAAATLGGSTAGTPSTLSGASTSATTAPARSDEPAHAPLPARGDRAKKPGTSI